MIKTREKLAMGLSSIITSIEAGARLEALRAEINNETERCIKAIARCDSKAQLSAIQNKSADFHKKLLTIMKTSAKLTSDQFDIAGEIMRSSGEYIKVFTSAYQTKKIYLSCKEELSNNFEVSGLFGGKYDPILGKRVPTTVFKLLQIIRDESKGTEQKNQAMRSILEARSQQGNGTLFWATHSATSTAYTHMLDKLS